MSFFLSVRSREQKRSNRCFSPIASSTFRVWEDAAIARIVRRKFEGQSVKYPRCHYTISSYSTSILLYNLVI